MDERFLAASNSEFISNDVAYDRSPGHAIRDFAEEGDAVAWEELRAQLQSLHKNVQDFASTLVTGSPPPSTEVAYARPLAATRLATPSSPRHMRSTGHADHVVSGAGGLSLSSTPSGIRSPVRSPKKLSVQPKNLADPMHGAFIESPCSQSANSKPSLTTQYFKSSPRTLDGHHVSLDLHSAFGSPRSNEWAGSPASQGTGSAVLQRGRRSFGASPARCASPAPRFIRVQSAERGALVTVDARALDHTASPKKHQPVVRMQSADFSHVVSPLKIAGVDGSGAGVLINAAASAHTSPEKHRVKVAHRIRALSPRALSPSTQGLMEMSPCKRGGNAPEDGWASVLVGSPGKHQSVVRIQSSERARAWSPASQGVAPDVFRAPVRIESPERNQRLVRLYSPERARALSPRSAGSVVRVDACGSARMASPERHQRKAQLSVLLAENSATVNSPLLQDALNEIGQPLTLKAAASAPVLEYSALAAQKALAAVYGTSDMIEQIVAEPHAKFMCPGTLQLREACVVFDREKRTNSPVHIRRSVSPESAPVSPVKSMPSSPSRRQVPRRSSLDRPVESWM